MGQPAARVRPAHRPSPRPPPELRPRRLSVTQVETLIRDPYSIYASEILRLKALDPLTPEPDNLERGTHLHAVMERWARDQLMREGPLDPAGARAALLATAEAVLAEACGWPVHRRLWLAGLVRAADGILTGEILRRAEARPHLLEVRGEIEIGGVLLVAKADRIDRAPDGRVRILDYKTGKPPTKAQQAKFAKQLLIEAVMAEAGAFADLGPVTVAGAAYVGLGAEAKVEEAPLAETTPAQVREELALFLANWRAPLRGYSSHIALEKESRWVRDHDHLARFGEWDHSMNAVPEDVGW